MTQPTGPKRPASPLLPTTDTNQPNKKQKSSIENTSPSMDMPSSHGSNLLARIEEIKSLTWQETLNIWTTQAGLTYEETQGRIEAAERITICFENGKSDLELEELHLSSLPYVFEDRIHLKNLNIRDNKQIEDVSALNCSHLRCLEAINCNIKSIGNLDLPITLTTLIISENKSLKSINISSLTELKIFEADNCNLSSFDEACIPNSLEQLSLSENINLEHIYLKNLVNLKEFKAEGCDLKSIDFNNIPSSLIILSVADNHELSQIGLSHIINLKELNLESCNLSTLKLSHLPTKLETLDVSHNNLKEIDCSHLLNLKALFLNNCNLENITLPNPALLNLEMPETQPFKLQEICLSNNPMLDNIDEQLQILINHRLHHLELANTRLQWENLPQQLRDNQAIYIDIRPQEEVDQNINAAQNTHTASIHASSSWNASHLMQKNPNLNIAQSWSDLRKFIETLSIENTTIDQSSGRANQSFKNATAQRYIQHPSHLEHVDETSNVSVQQFLALSFAAIDDDNQRVIGVSPQDGKDALVNGLYEIQRGYNLNEEDNPQDNAEQDDPICAGGTFNKISEKLVSILKDMKYEFVNQTTFIDRVKHEIKAQAQYLLTTAVNKENLLSEVRANDNCLTKTIWEKIQPSVCEKIKIAFEGITLNGKNVKQLLAVHADFETALKYLPVID